MKTNLFWVFQGVSHSSPKVCQQEVSELTRLAAGLIAFEKVYLSTHGEKRSVTNLLSMINRFVAENIDVIEADMSKDYRPDIPF